MIRKSLSRTWIAGWDRLSEEIMLNDGLKRDSDRALASRWDRSPSLTRGGFALQLGESASCFLNVGGKIRHFLDLANLDDLVAGGGTLRGPGDRLIARSNLDHPVAADHLLGLGEG